MMQLITIDLRAAALSDFERYETTVLALLPKYGGRLHARVRTIDSKSETHLVQFPDAEAREAFLRDPARLAARALWDRCGATASAIDVEPVG